MAKEKATNRAIKRAAIPATPAAATNTTTKARGGKQTISRIPISLPEKCDEIKALLDAPWVNNEIRTTDFIFAKKVTDGFIKHLSQCSCAAKSTTKIAIASSYMQQFMILSNNVISNLDSIDRESKNAEELKEREKAANYLSDFIGKPESKFNSNYANQVNFRYFNYLISPAIKALNYFQESFEDDKTEKRLSKLLISNTRVFTHFKALFQIFLYYDLEDYAYKTVSLALSFIQTYISKETNVLALSEDIQVIHCNMLRLLLNTGCIENVRSYFKQHFIEFNCDDIDTINTYGKGLIFLLHCEISLRLRRSSSVSKKLKQFIESEYLRMPSIKRFSLKIMALALASRFPSATYSFSDNFIEFVEPFQSSLSICRRWDLFHPVRQGNIFDDPLWYKFTVFNLVSETGDVFLNFYTGIGILADASHYFRQECNLYCFTLNIIRLAKMQLVAANLDYYNGYISDTKAKLLLFRSLFSESYSKSLDQSIFINTSAKDENVDNEEQLSLLILEFDPLADAEANCDKIDFMQSYRQLLKLGKRDFSSDDDHMVPILNVPTLVNKTFSQINKSRNVYKSTFYLHLKLIALELMVNYAENKSNVNFDSLLLQCNQLLSVLENYTMKCHFPQLQGYFKHSTNLRTSMEEQKMYHEALCYLNKIVDFSTYSLETRMHRCEMFYYRGLVIYKLLNNSNSEKSKQVIKLSCDLLTQSPFESEVQCLTPTTKPTIRRDLLNNAPKRTNFDSPTVGQYASELLQVADKACAEGTRRHANKLNFDEPESTSPQDIIKSKSIKKVKNALRSGKRAKAGPLTVYQDPEGDQDLITNFDRALKLDDSENDQNSSETYFSNTFDFSKFKQEFDITKYTREDIKLLIHKITSYAGLHPSLWLYHHCQLLSYKYAKMNEKHPLVLLYHLAESANYVTYRYRSILIAHRKAALRKEQADVSQIVFKAEDFSYISYTKVFPKQWRFVQIKLVDTKSEFPHLLISRFQDEKSVFLKIKSKQQERVLEFFLAEFAEIMKGNSASLTEVNREVYWRIRFDLDRRLMMLLESFELNYLGPFKAIFLGQVEDKAYHIARAWFKKGIFQAAKESSLECTDLNLWELYSESVIFLTQVQFDIGLKILFGSSDKEFIAKADKIKNRCFSKWATAEKVENLFMNVAPVGLVLDSQVSQFPFESMPCARRVHQPFFRVPSLRIAANLYNAFKPSYLQNAINEDNAYYLLNPANNLDSTQTFFKAKLEEIAKWNGLIGGEPKPIELKQHLEKDDLFLFFGHGSGSIYYRKIPDGGLDGVNINSVSIVIGCSSGRVSAEGKLEESYGVPYRFLINGSPCYIGNLWDVTDKDIDIFSDRFLAHSLKNWKSDLPKVESLPKAIAMSRAACKLPHLIGCAPVVYGLPLNNRIV